MSTEKEQYQHNPCPNCGDNFIEWTCHCHHCGYEGVKRIGCNGFTDLKAERAKERKEIIRNIAVAAIVSTILNVVPALLLHLL